MLDRLLGLETEYANRYSGPGPRPSHATIFEAIVEALEQLVATRDGARKTSRRQRFLENGGAIYYECLPRARDGGLVEASTPECRGPSQLLLYQRAQERLLIRALPGAMSILARAGFDGELGLVKNCRDAEGHVYGAQENYEVEVARGPLLWLYRIALALMLPPVLITASLCTLLVIGMAITYFGVAFTIWIATIVWSLLVPRHEQACERFMDRILASFTKLERVADLLAIAGSMFGSVAYSLLFRLCCCRGIRRDVLAFLISRPLVTGAGTLDPQTGELGLSEKGPAIRALVRTTVFPGDRALFDIGNLIKQLHCVMDLRLRPLASLFHRRQRLQLGLSDSNCAQQAEYLKLATTSLVLDMAEAGALQSLPRVRRPIAALHRLCADPTLKAAVPCTDGVARTGLELQRLYLDAARRFIAESTTTSLEARELVEVWAEVLDTLERDPGRVFGSIDWVTKRGLLAGAGGDLELADRKKIDLKYHELGVGYAAMLERAGLAPRLIGDDEIERAMRAPPQDTPARRRSQLIRTLAASEVAAIIDWDHVRIRRGFLRREVIRLDDYRT